MRNFNICLPLLILSLELMTENAGAEVLSPVPIFIGDNAGVTLPLKCGDHTSTVRCETDDYLEAVLYQGERKQVPIFVYNTLGQLTEFRSRWSDLKILGLPKSKFLRGVSDGAFVRYLRGAPVDSAYYQQLDSVIQTGTPEEFIQLMTAHESNIRNARFKTKSSEDVWHDEISRIAKLIVRDSSKERFLDPDEINDMHMSKLQIMSGLYGIDFLKDIKISYTAYRPGSKSRRLDRFGGSGDQVVKYDVPLLLYMVSGKNDISEYQLHIIEDLIASQKSAFDLNLYYSVTPDRRDHFKGKALIHFLLESGDIEDQPIKKRLAENLLAEEEHRNALFWTYEFRQRWLVGDYENRVVGYDYQALRGVMDAAVSSGYANNVIFALEQGVEIMSSQPEYGGTTLANAAKYSFKPNYLEICWILINHAAQMEDRQKAKAIMSGGFYEGGAAYRSKKSTLELLARSGNIDAVISLAINQGVGEPILGVEFTHHQYKVFERHGDDIFPFYTERVKTHHQPWYYVVGERKAEFVKYAVFNNLRGDGRYYDSYQSIFEKAVNALVRRNVVDKDLVNVEHPNFLNFCQSLRNIGIVIAAKNEAFIRDGFGDDFIDMVRDAVEATNNFETVFQAEQS